MKKLSLSAVLLMCSIYGFSKNSAKEPIPANVPKNINAHVEIKLQNLYFAAVEFNLTAPGSKTVNIEVTNPASYWYGSIVLRDDQTGVVTTTTYGHLGGSYTMPKGGQWYTFRLIVYSSLYPSGIESENKSIYVPN